MACCELEEVMSDKLSPQPKVVISVFGFGLVATNVLSITLFDLALRMRIS